MKQYVLDEPIAAAAALSAEPQAPRVTQPGWWRWLALAVVLEAVVLAVLYLAVNGVPGSGTAAPAPGVAYVAAFSFPREAQAALAQAPAVAAPVSRVRQERGRYVVELHDETPASALAMLSEATRSHVAGANVLAGSPVRLTRSVVAASPREAWQAVFGDVANFVLTCAGSACDVRFVSLAAPGSGVSVAAPPGTLAESPPAAMPPVDPVQMQSYPPVVRAPKPEAVGAQQPENSESEN